MSIILTEKEMVGAIRSLNQHSDISYDLETTGLDPYKGSKILGIAFGHKNVNHYYLPLRHEVGENAPIEIAFYLDEYLTDENITLITWNGKFDLHFTKAEGLATDCKVRDVMLIAHLYDELAMPFSLKDHALIRFGESALEEQNRLIELGEEYLPKLMSRLRSRKSKLEMVMGNLKYLPMEKVAKYAMKDLLLTEKLDYYYNERLKDENFYNLIPQLGEYSKVIRKCEENGLYIDVDKTKELAWDAKNCMKEVIEEIYDKTAFKVNPNSWKQVKELLLENSEAYRNLPSWEQTTDEGTLSKLDDPLCKLVSEYHKWSKVKGTYYDMFLEMIDDNNTLHYSMKIHGTITTRPSCPKPAIQTIPRQNEKNYMYKVKDCVISHPGWSLVEVDYSQLELRLAAHFSKEPKMVSAYKYGLDLHTVTGDLLGISRQDAKPINFGFLYGSGAKSFRIFAEEKYGLKLTLEQAEKFRKQFFDSYPGLVVYTKKITQFAEQKKYIRLITGRKLHFEHPDLYYTALNKQIQGSGAELLRISMTKLNRKFEDSMLVAPKMLIPVHDSLLFEIQDNLVDYWIPIIKKTMTDFSLNVPLGVDFKTGNCWGSLEKYDVAGVEEV